MCGIAGIYRLTGPPTAEDALAVLRMLDAQRHRGPDDWGLLVPDALRADPALRTACAPRAGSAERVCGYRGRAGAPGAVLGVRRLAILDVSARGRMPMGSRDGARWVVHNGEVYNFRALRGELARAGAAFDSDSDTEAILHGAGAWGDGWPARLRGMFATGVLETAPGARLLLARDRLGIKPLYYHADAERLAFASEVQALGRSGAVAGEPDREAVVRYLQLGSVPAPRTAVRGVRALPAGHRLIAGPGGVDVAPYWRLPAGDGDHGAGAAGGRPGDAAAMVRARLEEAVALHLASDVPLGIFLSGGIDSSALVALASRLRERPVTTLSVGFAETAYSELPHARLVAERFGTDHREIVVGERDFHEALPGFFAALDQPTVDGVNTWMLSAAARRAGLTVALSGTGGDEVFLGYPHLARARGLGALCGALGALPAALRGPLASAGGRLGAACGHPGADRLAGLAAPTPENAYLAVRGLFGARAVADLLGLAPREVAALGPIWPGLGGWAGRTAAGTLVDLDFEHYLGDQLLRDTDVMGMAHSLEIRVPYLDHRLVEDVLALPLGARLGRGRPKPLLLDALGGDLPAAVWDREKMGFTLPFDRWLRSGAGMLRARTLEQPALEPRAVARTWNAFEEGRLHWSRVWALVVLAEWSARRGPGWRGSEAP